MDELILTVDGYRFSGWQGLKITRSMEQGPHEFELDITNAWRTSDHRKIPVGAPCTLHCDNELIITGAINDKDPEYDGQKQTLIVRGRSKLGDLVDCSTLGKQYDGQTLDAIARDVCKPFGVDVLVQTDVGKAFEWARRDDGQSPWEFLDYLARIRAVRLIGDEFGRLILTRAGNRLAATALVLGKNIERASGNFSDRERFGEYLVVGKNGTLSGAADDVGHVQGRSLDKHVLRYRPKVIIADDDGETHDCQSQADWQRNTHYGRAQQIVYTVRGWREQPRGRVWMPNTRVQIDDGYMEIKEERMLIEAQLRIDKEGRYTELATMPREAIELVPLPEPKEKYR